MYVSFLTCAICWSVLSHLYITYYLLICPFSPVLSVGVSFLTCTICWSVLSHLYYLLICPFSPVLSVDLSFLICTICWPVLSHLYYLLICPFSPVHLFFLTGSSVFSHMYCYYYVLSQLWICPCWLLPLDELSSLTCWSVLSQRFWNYTFKILTTFPNKHDKLNWTYNDFIRGMIISHAVVLVC